ncbi:hypothetical protein, partial [Stenotrophomonas maltophilia]|uniref:hypothetical protein n=1 Tax=Stenotrophomonas maltophilia TaxID=40324 RepID=UPI001C657E76
VSCARGTRAEIQSQKKKAKSKTVANQGWHTKGEAPRSQKCVERGRMGLCGTVGAMDGAIEPPWKGSRRVPGSPANPTHAMKPNEATP